MAQEVSIGFVALAIHDEDSIGVVPEAPGVVRVSSLVGAWILDIESALRLILPDYLSRVKILLSVGVLKRVVLGIF